MKKVSFRGKGRTEEEKEEKFLEKEKRYLCRGGGEKNTEEILRGLRKYDDHYMRIIMRRVLGICALIFVHCCSKVRK